MCLVLPNAGVPGNGLLTSTVVSVPRIQKTPIKSQFNHLELTHKYVRMLTLYVRHCSGSEDIAGNKIDKDSCPHGASTLVLEKTENK